MKVLLLAGGDSSENQVSLNSGDAIFNALKRLGHEVTAIDPADGRKLIAADGSFQKTLPDIASTAIQTQKNLQLSLSNLTAVDADVVFLGLHGGTGENGTLQCLLDLAGVKYTGSGMTASAIAMNKAISKRLFASMNIPTPEWGFYQVDSALQLKQIAARVGRQYSFPIIIKPNEGGSTVGLSKVNDPASVPAALQKAIQEGPGVLVEAYIPGRELTVAVLNGSALPIVEIKPKNELYDYQAKYTKGMSEYVAPAELEPGLAVHIQRDAEKAYEAIGAAGLIRVDFILDPTGKFFCLEINTLPGMTNLSLAPMAANCAGISFDELVDRIIKAALER